MSPNSHLTIKVNDKDREFFMSYGLLTELTRVKGIEEPANILLTPEVRDDVLRLVLAERTKTGKVEKNVEDILDFDISIEDIEVLLSWVTEHTLDFFLRNLKRIAETVPQTPSESQPAG